MDLYKLNNSKLEQLESEPFKLERDIQTLIEDNCREIFNLKFVKTEFTIQKYRIDSLCFDEESNSFVIIEYKKTHSYSVIDQGFSYLSTMLNNKADFVLEFNESTGDKLKRDEVDWSQSRVIFVSPSFNSYQKDSVNFRDMPFELWEIKHYQNGLIGLNQISSNSKESVKTIEKGQQEVLKEVNVLDESEVLQKTSEDTKELYEGIKNVVSGWEDVNFKVTPNYIAILKGNKVKIYLNIQKSQIKIHLLRRADYNGKVDTAPVSFNIDDPKGFFELRRFKNHKELYEYFLTDASNLDYVLMILKAKYNS